MVGSSRNFEDTNVIVPGLEFGEDFDILGGDAVLLGSGLGGRMVGGLGFWRQWVEVDWLWRCFGGEMEGWR